MNKHWKCVERQVASYFGTKRIPLSGINSGHNTHSDSHHLSLYIETKYRKKFAIASLYKDTAEKAKLEGKTPVCCIKEKGMQGFLIICSSQDIDKIIMERDLVK